MLLLPFVPLAFSISFFAHAQQKASEKPPDKSSEKAVPEQHPAQIELLETKVRFEANGDSRKEVHALVKIQSELGVRQFAQLNFDFNRSFESVEIPMVHITHSSGGTADILPSAVSDHPNPAVVNFPAYQDVRVKSVRVLGLQPSDTLEYRVIRTVSHHPLAPDFWFEHSFDHSGVVQTEDFVLDLPASVKVQVNPATPADSVQKSDGNDGARNIFHWRRSQPPNSLAAQQENNGKADIAFSTLNDYGKLADKLSYLLYPKDVPIAAVRARADEDFAQTKTQTERLRSVYDFVSQKIKSVELPLGSTGYRTRKPEEIVASGYGTAEDKAALLAALARAITVEPYFYFTLSDDELSAMDLPTQFDHLLVGAYPDGKWVLLDPSQEVAPFGLISAKLRDKTAFCATETGPSSGRMAVSLFPKLPNELPFAATQIVNVDAALTSDGKLNAKVHYSMRGDNELVLRVAFHHTPKERWKEVAQLLSITDGFRGQVTSVNASDPYATKDPFTVEYELDQPKFVDWSKKPVRIPALLPQFGLPDPPAKPASGSATAPIELGTPLEVQTKVTLHLPPGTSASAPAGTSVERDYANYSSQYSVNGSTLTATRRIKFILREVPAARAADYNAFLRAVQSDESQDFTLESPANATPRTTSAAPNTTTPPKPTTPKP
jgi:transglutaminase-like putative cysteine protease